MNKKAVAALALSLVATISHAEIDLAAAQTRYEQARDVMDAQIKSHTYTPLAQATYRMEKERFENLKKWRREEQIANALKHKGEKS